MPDEITNKVIEELANQLPVKQIYQDIGSPAVAETGKLLRDIVKTLQLALAPIQFTAALQDRYESFLNESVRRIPEEFRVSPPSQILGPILEGIKYEPEETPIDEAFSHLLSTAMDARTLKNAHPAFPAIIKQLSSDEAKVLKEISQGPVHKLITLFDFDNVNGTVSARVIEQDTFPRSILAHGENLNFYMEHLRQLGLADLPQAGKQEPIMDNHVQIGVRQCCEYKLSDWGELFMAACYPKAS